MKKLSIVFLVALVASMISLRTRLPVSALRIGLVLCCQLLSATVLPLVLIMFAVSKPPGQVYSSCNVVPR